MPTHHCFEQGLKKSSVAYRLVLRTGGQRIGDVGEQSIVANDGAEIRRDQIVNDTNEMCAVQRIDLAEQASRKDAQLEELRDCLGFGFVAWNETKCARVTIKERPTILEPMFSFDV